MQVFVTPRAEKNFDSIFDYIKDKWGEKTAKLFVLKTDEIFKLLQIYQTNGTGRRGEHKRIPTFSTDEVALYGKRR